MVETVKQQPAIDGFEPAFIRLLIIITLFTVGVMLFIFSLAFLEDLETLSKAPELVWAFICGAPSDEGPALPLMLTLTTLALGGGVVFSGWHVWKLRQDKSTTA